jgi:electron transfer flavoprotein alpha subunit
MADVWVITETRGDEIKPVTYELLSAARDLSAGDAVTAVLIGHGVTALADEIGAHGGDRVIVLDDPQLATYSPDGWARALGGLVAKRQPAVVLAPATTRGRELGPGLAAHVGAGVASDVTELRMSEGHLEAVRPIYAGKALTRVKVRGQPIVATVRPGSFPPSDSPGAGEVEPVALASYQAAAVVTDLETVESSRPDVAEADVIVSGGRGMGGPEHFQLVESLADELGAAVGASRAVVDAGWRPHGEQVGQTGKTVSPTLYIACAISGAVQHLAGMKTSKVIVAINKDPEAPILSVADYGIVGDVHEVLPALVEAVREQSR